LYPALETCGHLSHAFDASARLTNWADTDGIGQPPQIAPLRSSIASPLALAHDIDRRMISLRQGKSNYAHAL